MTVITRALILSLLGLALVTITPPTTHAFQIFGLRFFENEPTPTPTVSPTPNPTPTPSPTPTATPAANAGQVLGDNTNLPHTGPAVNLVLVAGVMVSAAVARKYWQISHQM